MLISKKLKKILVLIFILVFVFLTKQNIVFAQTYDPYINALKGSRIEIGSTTDSSITLNWTVNINNYDSGSSNDMARYVDYHRAITGDVSDYMWIAMETQASANGVWLPESNTSWAGINLSKILTTAWHAKGGSGWPPIVSGSVTFEGVKPEKAYLAYLFYRSDSGGEKGGYNEVLADVSGSSVSTAKICTKEDCYNVAISNLVTTKGEIKLNTGLPDVTTSPNPEKIELSSYAFKGNVVRNTTNVESATAWFKWGQNKTNPEKTTQQITLSKDGDFTIPVALTNFQYGITYYFQACAKNKLGEICSENIESVTRLEKDEYAPPEVPPSKSTDLTYNPLAPLPGIGGINGPIDTAKSNAFSDYLNKLILLFIGLCAVLAFVMIFVGGIEYMTSELVSGKAAGIEKLTNAVLGLLLALGAFVILNTLNPELLNIGLNNIPKATITIDSFDVSGALTFDGQPIKVDFNKVAYPAAKIAGEKTGVDTAFILAIFAQETSSGSNTGKCNYLNANMATSSDPNKDQLTALKKIATDLKIDYTKINMSCSGGGSNNGGAIGLTQFIPTTWLQFKDNAAVLLGHQPNPWDIGDALMMAALKLKNDGGVNDQLGAACHYFGSCSSTVSCGGGTNGTYGQCVMGKKLSIQQQITDSINKGQIT